MNIYFNKKISKIALGIVIGLLLTACGNDNRTKEPPKRDIIGKFIDSAVEGVEYKCGNIIDFTDKNGTFSCTIFPVSFYIGAIKLGELKKLPQDKQVFPQDLVDINRSDVKNNQVVKLALLLQSLDEDNNASNGIKIPLAFKDIFNEEIVVSDITLNELKDKIQDKAKNITFKEIDEVVQHLSFSVGIIEVEDKNQTDNNIESLEEETPPKKDNNITSNEEETPSKTDDNVTSNEEETPSKTDDNVKSNEEETPPKTDDNVKSNEEETPPKKDDNVKSNEEETPPKKDDNVKSNEEETPSKTDDGGKADESNSTIIVENNSTETNTTLVVENNSTETNTTVVLENNSTEVNTTVVVENNNTQTDTNTNSEVDNSSPTTPTAPVIPNNNPTPPTPPVVVDTTAPEKPTVTTLPKFTNQESVGVQVNGEKDTSLFLNTLAFGTLNGQGILSISLDTSGDDGEKDFNLTLKDSNLNESLVLNVKIIKDSTPPAKNTTLTPLNTDDTTPALEGKLPSGDNDTNTTNYTIVVKLNNINYNATNNRDGTWSIADGTIDTLEIGTHDVNITVTDEANNSSSTFLSNKISIDNTGFLIDSALEGIKYVSGAYSGYTDKDGLFKYDKGAGVTFYIGDESTGISLGTATEKIDPYNSQRRIITLFDLAGSQDENSVRVINMGKFLQSLDSDNDVSNGITIDERTKESITLLGLNNRIDFDMDVEAFHNHNDIYELFNDLAGHFGEHRGLISADDAKAHLVAVRDNVVVTKSYEVAKVSGEKEAIKVLDGVFQSVGGVVEGLEYRSGNQFGRTISTGAFKYEEGKKIKFYIYQLELGITDAKAVITPADLIPATSFNHPKPRNIIRLLNAFDAPNSSNILIDDAVRASLEKYRSQIDINLPDGKANAELNIPQGADEFGAQFEDFEMGKDILDEIDTIRGSL